MQFATWTDPTKTTTKIVQASDAETLQKLVNAYIASLNGLTTAITAITLAGAGDGFTFVVLIETAPVGAADSTSSLVIGASGGLVPTLGGLPATQVRCYLAATADALAKAKGFIVPPTVTVGPVTVPTVVVDQQVAGAAKGTRFMGINVYSTTAIPGGTFEPLALFPLLEDTIALPPMVSPVLLNFGAPIVGTNWSLPFPNAIQYDGAGSFVGKFDASLTVQCTVGTPPVPVTAEFVESPLGTPVAFGGQDATIDVVPGSENIGLISIRNVFKAIAPATTQFGLRLTLPTPATFIILSGFLRISP